MGEKIAAARMQKNQRGESKGRCLKNDCKILKALKAFRENVSPAAVLENILIINSDNWRLLKAMIHISISNELPKLLDGVSLFRNSKVRHLIILQDLSPPSCFPSLLYPSLYHLSQAISFSLSLLSLTSASLLSLSSLSLSLCLFLVISISYNMSKWKLV